MSVFSNVIKPQGLEPLQFPTKFRSHSVDNQDLGLYSIVEQVNKRFLRHRYGTGRGMLLKPSTFGTFRYFQDDWPEYEKAYFPKTKVTPEQSQRLMEFARLVWIADDAEFSQAVET